MTSTPESTATRFVVGESYQARSAGDYDCVWTFTVECRTARFVTLVQDSGERMRVGVREWQGVESALPFGRYSMSPSIRADRPVVVERPSVVETEPEPRLVNITLVDEMWITSYSDGTVALTHFRDRGATGDLGAALRMLRSADKSVQGVLITDVRTGERWYTRRDVIESYELALQIRVQHMLDDWHRDQGHQLCWCNRWVHPDDMIENTCGARDCIRAEGLDRAGMVP